jgi:predicted nucleic acid-binding protein
MLTVRQPSPKVFDAYLAAHAAANEAELITFNQALTAYGVDCR